MTAKNITIGSRVLNRRSLLRVGAGLTVTTLVSACVFPIDPNRAPMGTVMGAVISTMSLKAFAFHNLIRKLWEDHITYTRLVIVSFAAGLPDTELNIQRLLQNQVEIGDALKPYYGAEAGNQLTTLLQEHVAQAGEILAAAKAGEQAKLDAATADWYENADALAAFFNELSVEAWPLTEMQMSLRMHLDQTLQQAGNQLAGKYAESIRDYDLGHEHILGLADLISGGVIRQFAERF